MKTVKIEKFKRSGELNEIYQPTGFLFAFLSSAKDGNRQCHQPVKCRDFLHDSVRAYLHQDSFKIYGFSYAYESNPPIDLSKTRMLVSKSPGAGPMEMRRKNAGTLLQGLRRGRKLLNHYEEMAGVKRRTEMHRVDDGSPPGPKRTWLFEGPSMWLMSPYLVSMYTLLIRLGAKDISFAKNKSVEEELRRLALAKRDRDHDNDYLKSCHDKLHLIIKHRKELFWETDIFSNYPKEMKISRFHNGCGIVALCNSSRTLQSGVNEAGNKLVKLYKKEKEKEKSINDKGKEEVAGSETAF